MGGEDGRARPHPSDTGRPGGKRAGQKCSHYIEPKGPFAVICTELLKTGLEMAWRSVPKPPADGKNGQRTKYECDGCGVAAWGKEGLNLVCGDCGEVMAPAS